MTAIAAVDVGALDLGAGQAFNLGDLALQGMAVIGQAGAPMMNCPPLARALVTAKAKD